MVKGAVPRNIHVSVHMPCTLNALSDGLEDSASEDVAIVRKSAGVGRETALALVTRGPQDTSSAQQDEVDCGKAGDAKRRSPPAPCDSRTAMRTGGGDAGGIEEKR